MDGCGELRAHFFEGEFAYEIEGHEFIFEPIVYEIFRRDRLVLRSQSRMCSVYQAPDFFYHAFLQACI